MTLTRLETKGQISIFLVIGVVLVLGIVLFFSLGDGISLFTDRYSDESIIRKNIISCLDSQLDSALTLSALRGGPLYDFSNKFITTTDVIEYYYTQPFVTIPKLEILSRDIDKHIYVNLDECFSNESVLYSIGYELANVRDDLGTVVFRQNSVEYYANLSFDVNVSGKLYSFSDLVATSDIPYLQMYNYASDLANNYYLTPSQINYDLSSYPDLKANVFVYDENTILHAISVQENNQTQFLFAVRLFPNLAPVVESIGSQYATLSSPLRLQIVAKDYDDELVTYSSTTPNVIVNSGTGELVFRPQKAGIYFVDVIVTDPRSASTSIRFEVRVDE